MSGVANFLAYLFEQGYQYRSINTYRSAISSVYERVDGYEVDQHPFISRTISGIFHKRSPQPRYIFTHMGCEHCNYIYWVIGEKWLPLIGWSNPELVMLFALTKPPRPADLPQLHLQFRCYLPEGVAFQPTKLVKQSCQTKPLVEFFFPPFPANKQLCLVVTLKAYKDQTSGKRQVWDPIFLSTIKPNNLS